MISPGKLSELLQLENQKFIELHPESARLAKQAKNHLLAGVPMPWMTRWPGDFPIYFNTASGAKFQDVDGLEYLDFCLGDTGAMTGHALPEVAAAVSLRAKTGITTMLPTEDAIWVAEELAKRFKLPSWQLAMSATDANRFVLRFARHLTKRPKICVMDWCYHGTVDETLAILSETGEVIPRPGALGPQVPVATTTAVVPFNDLSALEATLATGEIAAVLMEPALTNIGIVLPEPGYLAAVRELTQKYGTLLIIDETHTICAGPGGCTQAWDLSPDFIVIGKPIGGGIPVAAYGMTAEIAAKLGQEMLGHEIDVAGVGGTLTGNALAVSAVKATLSNALRPEDFAKAIPLASSFTAGVQRVITASGLPWHVQQLGCRAEYWFCSPPKDGAAAAAAINEDLDQFMHLWALNRGILLTPFHNMALFSPQHQIADVEYHTEIFNSAVTELLS